jgi:hypothetical protein
MLCIILPKLNINDIATPTTINEQEGVYTMIFSEWNVLENQDNNKWILSLPKTLVEEIS